ncbi:hypothetical protein MHF_0198 [Mycoplasma haemofelis Ohio2]|uniref:Uncharacterized protein n=1 Tax=Mycoplasma haemofelis (strain Ohio2) TaxID=859194 RepID=F6FGA7_MYCHI|nr:hypothetical protein MHF_0198 [Mycoplasma haemofelis Ohio2]
MSKLAERLPGEESKNVVVEVEKLSDGSYTFKTATITDQ